MAFTIYPIETTSAPGSYTFIDGYQLVDEAAFESDLEQFDSDAEQLKQMGYGACALVVEHEDGTQEVVKTA